MSKVKWQDYIVLIHAPCHYEAGKDICYFIWHGTREPVWKDDHWRSEINALQWITKSNWQDKVDEQFEKEFFK